MKNFHLKKKSKIKISLDTYVLFFGVYMCIHLIKYMYDLNENLVPKKVVAMPIAFEFLKTL